MDNKKIIGKQINAALAIKGIKQKDLAAHLNVTDNTISYYCSGTRTPSVVQLIEIAKFLDVSTDYLLGRTEDPQLKHSAVDELGLSEKAVSWLEWLKYQGECDPNYRKSINLIFEDMLFQRAFFNMVNYIVALDVETLSFKHYMKFIEYGPQRSQEALEAYAQKIYQLSQDETFSDRERALLKAEYERFTLDKQALWDVLSGDDIGFHFSKMFAYRASSNLTSLLNKFETESQKKREEFTNELLSSLDKK